MHISNCLYPKKIRNPYTHELQFVPCGKCSACLNAKSVNWVERLNAECSVSKYVVFVTLTYDNHHLPKLHRLGNVLYDPDYRVASDRPRISFNMEDIKCSSKEIDFIQSNYPDGVPYLSHYDAQCFIKRLRINLYRLCKKNNINEEESLLRFYLVGEYGPKNFRPHFHLLLFFQSEFASAHIQSLISKSWTFGYINSSFVKNSASSYVAKYLNCVSHLPSVLRYREIRPFAHFSKCPPIGSLSITDQTLQEIFVNSSPTMLFLDAKKRQINNVPLWRYVEDRLFPRCTRFGNLSHSDRVALYRAACQSQCQTSEEFVTWCIRRKYFNSSLFDLLSYLSNNFELLSPLHRLYYIGRAVWTQSSYFSVSIETYVSHIEKYFENCDYEKLKQQFAFQQDYTSKDKPASDLVWFDRFWLQDVYNHSKNLLFSQVDEITLMQLESFSIDIQKFFSSDLTERKEYFDSLLLFRCGDYLDLKVNSDKILKDSTKTKKKNDFLNSDSTISKSEIYEQFVSRSET